METQGEVKIQNLEETKEPPTHYINFKNASPEAIDSLITVLNAEVEEAIYQKRFPTLDGAFRRFASFTVWREKLSAKNKQ